MPNHRRKLLPFCIAASLLSGLSAETAAIGVGEIRLQSFLGSPLQAEVPLSDLGELGTEQLKVELATQDDYGVMGVEYNYLHSQLKIEPIVKNGRGYVRISTREPIAEPYLNFVLSLRWPQGQLVREFTVLLDPPAQAQAIAAASEPTAPVASAEPAAPAALTPRRQPRPVPAPQVAAGADSYTIQRGDSLWRIANRIRPAPMPVEQVMAAIQALNPDAFIDGNPHLLKEAVTIALPDAQQLAAAAGGATPALAAAPVSERGAEKTAVATAEAAPPVAQLLEENSTLKTQVADLTGNVASLNESLAQSEQRLRQLESQLSGLIQQMQQQRATMAALSGSPEAQGAQIAPASGSMINQVNAAELNAPVPAHTPWWVHLLYWLGIGGAVTWAVREHFWPQRRLAAAAIGGSAAPGLGAIRASAAPAARAAVAAPAGITTLQEAVDLSLDLDELPLPAAAPDGEPAPQLLRSNDEPVDASISAGVFVAFGRFSEAEQLLREAIARSPERVDLKLQLLDVLMQSDQPGAFDDLAAEIEREAHTPEALAELALLRDSYRPRH